MSIMCISQQHMIVASSEMITGRLNVINTLPNSTLHKKDNSKSQTDWINNVNILKLLNSMDVKQ